MFAFLTSIFCVAFHLAGWLPITQPPQNETGPGGRAYFHEKVEQQDYASKADGYWLFEPADPKPDSAHVVVFTHGYGGYNPMIYGRWIQHLVRRGNIVIFPRYQASMLSPSPDKFAANVSKAIRDALEKLNGEEGHVKPIVSKLALVGHSYGGVVSADLAVNFEKYEIPKPQVVLLCAPGSGAFKGGRLASYEKMPADLMLLIVVHEDDDVVGDEFGLKVFREATNVTQRNLLRQFADDHGIPAIHATHNQTYSLDSLYDCGIRNFTANRACRVSTEDAVDYHGYWKWCDALLECSRSGSLCEYAFGNTPEQLSLGVWSDGTPIRLTECTVP